MPRSDPVPTAPAPPIWKTDLGRIPASGRCSSSVRRQSGRSGSGGGRRLPLRPKKGSGEFASHSSPRRAAACQASGPLRAPCSRANQAGKPKAKSRPTASAGSRRAQSWRWRTSSLRERPHSRRTSRPCATSASQIRRSAPRAAPDQSTAIVLRAGAMRDCRRVYPRSPWLRGAPAPILFRLMTQQLARQLEHEFSPVLRAEGAQLVRDGRVSISEHAHGFLLAEVEDGEVYDVGLRWSDDQVRTDAACTCPRFRDGGSCPHLWAVIVAQAEAEEDEPEEAVKEEAAEPADWRFRLRLLRPPRTRKLRDPWKGVPPGSSRVVFVVGVDKTLNEVRVVLRLYQEKRLRNGRYGTRKALDLAAWREAPARDPLDVKVLGLLGESLVEMPAGGSSRNARTPAAHLDEAQAEVLLPLLCQSGRLFLEVGERRSSGALAWDAEQPWDLRFELTRDEELDQCLLDAVLVRGEQRIPLAEPWLFLGLSWFFLENALCRFRAHGAGPWLESIRREGPLRARLDEESELLRALLEQSGTPAVVAAGVRWAEVEPPRPHLWIGRRSGGSSALEARVSFDYAGVRVRASDELQVLKQPAADGALATLIRRDLAAESERLAQLLAAPGVEACEPDAQRDALVASERLVDLVRALLDTGWAVDAEGLRWRRSGTLRYSVHTGLDWFDLEGGLDFEGETASFPALLEAAREKRRTVKLGDGSIGILPERWLEDWRLFEALGEEQDDALRFERSQGWVLDALLAGRENVELDAGFESLRARIAPFSGVRALEQPAEFRGELRTYQREALGWLAFLGELGFGGCLADDMGLGKTVQVLAHLLARKRGAAQGAGAAAAARPCLVVTPRSLCFHWAQEAARFTPEL